MCSNVALSTLLLVLLLLITPLVEVYGGAGDNFFHQRPNQHKSAPGWQEPGLWRPMWIMDREYSVDQARSSNSSQKVKSEVTKRDRLYLRLTPERTVKFLHHKQRPLVEWYKKPSKPAGPTVQSDSGENRKHLFESGNEEVLQPEQQLRIFRAQQEKLYFDVDGTWDMQDETPANSAKIKIETREIENDGKVLVRVLHETRCDWGDLDGYAAKFRIGRLCKSTAAAPSDPINQPKQQEKSSRSSADAILAAIPRATMRSVGSFILRANVHRPLVSKDYQAFQ